MDFYRKQKRDPVEIPLDAAYLDDALDNIIKGQSYERLSVILKNLTPDEREFIRLRYLVDISLLDIALTLGHKEDAVKKSLKWILKRLFRIVAAMKNIFIIVPSFSIH